MQQWASLITTLLRRAEGFIFPLPPGGIEGEGNNGEIPIVTIWVMLNIFWNNPAVLPAH